MFRGKPEENTLTLEDLFGNSVLIKIVDFFLENRFWDYTKTDVANNIGVSRQSVYREWPTLEKFKIINDSRKIGATTLYRTNIDSPIVKKLSSLSLGIATIGIE